MKNKLLLSTVLVLLAFGSVYAQSIQLLMSPSPSAYLSDWQSRTETVTLIINNTSGAEKKVKIKAELFDGGGALIASTKTVEMPELTVGRGVTKYTAEDVFPLSAVSYTGSKASSVAQTGRIPDDNYKFCVSIVDPPTGVFIAQPACKMFTIVAFQAPTLIAPRENEVVAATNVKGILFRWTPVIPSPKTIVTYKLQVWEVLAGQTSMNALRTNQPIVDKDYKGIMQTQWPLDYALPEAGMTYVWTITPYDNEDRKLVDGYGFAQPLTFTIDGGKSSASISLLSPSEGQEIDLSTSTTFRWTTLVPKPQEPVTYKIKVWQLMQGQNGTQAMRSNSPIFEKDVVNATELNTMLETGPCKLPYLCDFVWSVMVVNADGTIDSGNPPIYALMKAKEKMNRTKCQAQRMAQPVVLNNGVTFKWFPADLDANKDRTYRIKVWQLMQGQNGTSAMKTNKPIFEKDVVNATELNTMLETGPCKPPYLCDFVWSVMVAGNEETADFSEFKAIEAKSEVTPLSPVKGEELDLTNSVSFRWTPLVPKPQEPVTYRIKVWQLMDGQNSTTAMKTNTPIFEKDVVNATELNTMLETGPCKPPYLCEFVWSVMVVNADGTVDSGNPPIYALMKAKEKMNRTKCQAQRMAQPVVLSDGVTFKWFPADIDANKDRTYRIKVWQLMQGQNGTSAMKTNKPIFEKDVVNATELNTMLETGPCKPPYLCDFVWSVMVVGKDGTEGVGEFRAVENR